VAVVPALVPSVEAIGGQLAGPALLALGVGGPGSPCPPISAARWRATAVTATPSGAGSTKHPAHSSTMIVTPATSPSFPRERSPCAIGSWCDRDRGRLMSLI